MYDRNQRIIALSITGIPQAHLTSIASRSRSPTHKSQPYSGSGKLHEREVVDIVLLVSGRDSPEVLEFVEEAFDEVTVSVEEGAERRHPLAAREWLDVGPGALRVEGGPQRIAVIGGVAEQDLIAAESAEHIGGTSAIMSLTFGQLQADRQAVGVDERVDLGRQPASRAPHAAGVISVPKGGRGGLRSPLLTLAAC